MRTNEWGLHMYNYANKMKYVKKSAIRSVMAEASENGKVDYISFASGFPDPEAIPQKKLEEAGHKILKEKTYEVLQYGSAQGYKGLIESSKAFINQHETVCTEDDDIIITTGSQQGLDLVSKIFCDEGDFIAVENPSYLGALNSFKCNGAKLIGVPLEEDGVNLKELEKAFEKGVKLFYTIPNFQNPTGITTSLEKRKAICKLAKKYNVVVLEDNPYGYLRITGESVPSIKSLDQDHRVIYAASLSKIISPGMRTGIICANQDIISKLFMAKQSGDNHTNNLSQYIMDSFLRETDMDSHIKNLQSIYARKCNFMLDMIQKYFHPSIHVIRPEGGMFIWFDLPEGISMPEFVQAAIKEHVAIVPGNEFMVDSTQPCQSIRMNFSAASMENIEKGIQILGKLTYQFCEK